MAEGLYSSFADILLDCQSKSDDLSTLLDPQRGFALRLRQICLDRVKEIKHDTPLESIQVQDALKMEGDTWALLQALLPVRRMVSEKPESARDLLEDNPYLPTFALAQNLMGSSPRLMELVILREWLHDTADVPEYTVASTGYWRLTQNKLVQAIRTGTLEKTNVVDRLDPDAPGRLENKLLDEEDMAREKALIQALYQHLRAGRLEDAIDICRKSHQPWRAATIRGTELFSWSAILDQGDDPEEMRRAVMEGWSGNNRRRQWKAACIQAALNPRLSDHERVFYAALAPSFQTTAVLRSACRTWEDYLWAHLSIICEERLSSRMFKLRDYWETGELATDHMEVDEVDEEEEEKEEKSWEKEVKYVLKGMEKMVVDSGAPADHPFHFTQLRIILGEMDNLIKNFASQLQEGDIDQKSPEYPILIRFFAHLGLYLQMIEDRPSSDDLNTILEAYIMILEDAGQRNLIAIYAGALGDMAVQRYAMFLASLGTSADKEERRKALLRAQEHGLEMREVAEAAMEITHRNALKRLPTLSVATLPLYDLDDQTPPSDAEMFFLRSVEWATFDLEMGKEALTTVNSIVRYLLMLGRVHLLKSLFDLLPPDWFTMENVPGVTELNDHRRFYNVWEMLGRLREFAKQDEDREREREQGVNGSGRGRGDRKAWVGRYKELMKETKEQAELLFISFWLNYHGQDAEEERAILKVYYPIVIKRLSDALLQSSKYFPENLRQCLDLANLVADARYSLYGYFSDQPGWKLEEYLECVRRAVGRAVEGGGSDVFWVLDGRY